MKIRKERGFLCTKEQFALLLLFVKSKGVSHSLWLFFVKSYGASCCLLLFLLRAREQVTPICSFCKEPRSKSLPFALSVKSQGASCSHLLFLSVRKSAQSERVKEQKSKRVKEQKSVCPTLSLWWPLHLKLSK